MNKFIQLITGEKNIIANIILLIVLGFIATGIITVLYYVISKLF